VAASGSVTSNYNGEDIRCVGSSDGVITVTSSGGTGAYNYKLDQVPSNTTGDGSGIYSGLSAGTFTVTARDVNNCFIVTTPITLTPPAALSGSASITSNYNGRQLRCFGSSDGVITVTSGGGVGGFDFVLNEIPGNVTGLTSGVFTGVPSGTYTITMTDDNTCQRVTTAVTINDPPVLTAASSVTSNYNGAQVTCNGASDGTIKVTPTGGTAAYSYTFVEIPGNTSGSATGTFTGVPAGAYTFNVLDINNCPVTTTPVTISEPTPVIASAVVDAPYNGQHISCNGVDDGAITVTGGGGTGAITYVFDQFALTNLSGKFSGVFSGVGAGTGYTFTATDVNGCPVTTSPVNVVEPAAIAATLSATSNYNGFDISCFNLTDGEVSVITPTGGTGALSYLLLENPGNVTGQTSGVFTGLRAGSYRVRITDQNFCQFITTAIPVTQPTDINVEIDITSNYNGYHVSCIGASDGAVSVTTIAGGATATSVAYKLDQILTNTSGDASGVYAGVPSNLYTVTATDANGCPKTSLPVVLIDPLPLFEGIVGLDKSVCVGANPTAFTELATAFGGIGNYGYQWQQSTDGVLFADVVGATSATFDPPVLPVTTFFKRRITSGTCATLESNTVSVTVNPLPTATLVPSKTPVCEGDFFLLNFAFTGQAPFYFDYNDGTNFTNDRLGAAATPVPVLNYTNTTTYTITEVRDFNGCVANVLPAPVTIPVVKINPIFSITSSAAQCSGGEFDFTFTVDPNTEYTWIWGDGQTDVIAANSLAVGTQPISHIYESMNTAGTTSFPVILSAINNVNNCGPKQTNQTIQIYPNILINLFPDKTEICGGDQVTFTNPTAGGTTHHWFYRQQGVVEERDERTFVAASDQTFTFNNTTTLNPIIYELVYEVNNANCAADTVIEVTVYREVAAAFSKTNPVPLFIGGNANMTFTNTSAPIDGTEFRYDWDFGTAAAQAPVSGIGPFNFNYTAPGTKTVRLVATNLVALANGISCASTYQETFNIVLPPLVAGFEYTPQATCFPANITITRNLATGNVFEWRLVDGNGRQLLVTNDTLPTFTISSAGRYAIFQTTRNSLTGQSASADNAATGNNAAPYNAPIDIYQTPFAGFEARPTVVYVPDTQLQVFNMSSSPVDPLTATSYPIEYRWYFGDGTDTLSTADSPENFEPSHFYINEGAYDIALLAVNDHGNGAICYDTAIKRIQAKAAGFTRIPNAFTPSTNGPTGGVGAGGNSVNDVFLPVAKGIVEFQMQIFDRWGNLVFQSLDKTIGWDGYDKNGNLLPAGVYVYKLTLRLSNDQRTTQIGDVTLIR
jgi:gliding motility-associated-like protein